MTERAVASDNKMVDALEKRPEAGVVSVPEGSGLRLDSEQVPEMETQNVERTLQ